MTTYSEAISLRTVQVSADFFPLLGLHTVAERVFIADDFQAQSPRVAIISSALCQRWMGSIAACIGRVLVLDRTTYTVVGLLSRQLEPLPYRDIDAWLPLLPGRAQYTSALGRLKIGINLKIARIEAQTIAERGPAEFQRIDR